MCFMTELFAPAWALFVQRLGDGTLHVQNVFWWTKASFDGLLTIIESQNITFYDT